MPKIDKDYSLYRTYVIFRTLGLRHLVVVNVHNHVVGIITRKDLLPFKMQERLESLLELTITLNTDIECELNGDVPVPKQSLDSGKGSSFGFKQTRSADAISTLSGDVALPAITRASSASKLTHYGQEEKGETYSITSVATSAEDSDSDPNDSVILSQIVVTVSPPADDTSSPKTEP